MHGYLEKISSSGDHLLTLINDVLEMSRIETGHMELKPAETDLCDVLYGVRDMFAEQMRQKNVAFTVDGDAVQNSRVLCDANRLNRILLNLVSNAYKFTPEGGSVSVTLKQTGRRNDLADYELMVADTGIGMSEEFAARIFEPFERERTSTVSGIQGTGLGMAITKAIVDSMDGCIDVQSKQGEGSRFTVLLTFPVLSGDEGGCHCEEKPEEPKKRDYTGRRLLLAEDNEINREIACAILTDAGFAVDTAENGQVAVGMLEGSTPGTYDAVLMDIQMPVMDGFEASKAIRSLPDAALAAVPIIAMTANAFAEDVAAERAAGMDGHISKPLNQQDMFRTLDEILFG
ncbi:MAG: response regulator, partial [Firmicutes bacterium]|nr:response regulator [Bacillota bacterium]